MIYLMAPNIGLEAHFRGTQDDGQLLFLLGADDALQDPVLAECDGVDEAQSAKGLVVVAPRHVPLMYEMDQVSADIGRAQLLGRLAEVLCKLSDTLDVNLDCPGACPSGCRTRGRRRACSGRRRGRGDGCRQRRDHDLGPLLKGAQPRSSVA